MGLSRKKIAVLLGIAVTAILAFGYVKLRDFGRELQRAWMPVTDMSRYQELLAVARSQGLASHFPDGNPATATAFHYTPHFLQGPLVLQLKCRIPPDEIDAAMEVISTLEMQSENAKRHVDPNAPRPHDYTVDTEFADVLSESYDVHMLYAEDHSDNSSWNHGAYEGVAIDSHEGVMLYFLAAW